jgi:hypothetical protein
MGKKKTLGPDEIIKLIRYFYSYSILKSVTIGYIN